MICCNSNAVPGNISKRVTCYVSPIAFRIRFASSVIFVTCYCKIVLRKFTEIEFYHFKSIVDGLQAGLFTELIFLEHYEPSIGIQK